MRIAFDASVLQAPRTGVGEYTLQLGQALQQLPEMELCLFDGLGWPDTFPETPRSGYGRASRLIKALLPGAYPARRALMQLRFNQGIRRLKPELYHQPTLWPLEFDGPTVMTLHDLTHVHYPETQPRDRLREIERRLPASLQRASRILVDSRFIAEEAIQHYSLPADKLQVAPLGAAPRFHPRDEHELQECLTSFGVGMRSYYLCVGTLEPRKNLKLAVDAYLGLPKSLRERMPLVIVGGAGWRQEQLEHIPARELSSGRIRLLGYKSGECVAQLLAGAHALLFPSRYEGFGLPVLEALASATPVIACDHAAVPEVAGDAALYADAEDTDGYRTQMLRLIEDSELQQRLRQGGLERSRQFSWERCARITTDTYKAARYS